MRWISYFLNDNSLYSIGKHLVFSCNLIQLHAIFSSFRYAKIGALSRNVFEFHTFDLVTENWSYIHSHAIIVILFSHYHAHSFIKYGLSYPWIYTLIFKWTGALMHHFACKCQYRKYYYCILISLLFETSIYGIINYTIIYEQVILINPVN